MKIKELISGVLGTFKSVFTKDNPIKLGRLLTPEISELDRDGKGEICFQKIFNIVYCTVSIACSILMFFAYSRDGLLQGLELGLLCLIAFAFGGVIIQIIRPIAKLKPGPQKSKPIPGDVSAFKDISVLKGFDEVLKSLDDNSIDTNQALALVNVIFSHNLQIQPLSRLHMAEWLVDRYEKKFCKGKKGRYSGKVILNAENSEPYVGRWNIRINEMLKTPAVDTES